MCFVPTVRYGPRCARTLSVQLGRGDTNVHLRTALTAAAAICGAGLSLSACGSTDESGSSGKSPSTAAKDTPKSCGTKATEDCTPHVAKSGTVRVDALLWHVRSARTVKTIGDQTYGLDAKATGRFVVVKLKVHSDRNESAQLSDNVIKLEIDGNTYDPDNDGTVAVMGAGGDQPFFLDTIGPDSDRNGTVVFDVPTSKLSHKIEVRFGELGFGETHGYIRLPGKSGSV
jgi:hypothetical protein